MNGVGPTRPGAIGIPKLPRFWKPWVDLRFATGYKASTVPRSAIDLGMLRIGAETRK